MLGDFRRLVWSLRHAFPRESLRVTGSARLDGIVVGSAQLVRPPRNNEAQAFQAQLTTTFVAPWALLAGMVAQRIGQRLAAWAATQNTDTRRIAWLGARTDSALVLSAASFMQSRAFAGRPPDRFLGVGWRPGRSGAPILAGVLAWIECTVEAEHAAGDHVIVVGRVQDLDVGQEGRPLVFYRGGYGRFEP